MSRFVKLFLLLCISHRGLLSQDSLTTIHVLPGVRHTKHVKAGPYALNVLEVDLTNPRYRVESYRTSALTKTSVQAEDHERSGHDVIAAVNADFFSFKTQWPLGNQVVNGKFVLGTRSRRSHIVFDERNKVYIERLSFRGFVLHGGRRWEIDGVNNNRSSNETVFYTSYWGPSTGADTVGTKLVVKLAGNAWVANDTLLFLIIERIEAGAADIPDHGGVLATPPGLAGATVNDTVKAFLGFSRFSQRVTQVVGGGGHILESGKNVSEASAEKEGLATKFLTDRHPRTFVGFDRDTTRLFLCTVDGRQPSSLGMHFEEMAKFLVSTGAWNGINLDGGGSTTMVIGGRVANSPSDKTGERAVANSLQIISLYPAE